MSVEVREERLCQYCRQVKSCRTCCRGGQTKNPAICDQCAEKNKLKWSDEGGHQGWQDGA